MIDNDILDIIACPKCKDSLVLNKSTLLCNSCKKSYEIIDDIPVFIDK